MGRQKDIWDENFIQVYILNTLKESDCTATTNIHMKLTNVLSQTQYN